MPELLSVYIRTWKDKFSEMKPVDYTQKPGFLFSCPESGLGQFDGRLHTFSSGGFLKAWTHRGNTLPTWTGNTLISVALNN